MSRSPVRRVAVVGGGIAGLTLAAAVGPDVEVVVHEAQPERWGSGSSLALWPSAVRALRRLGVMDRLGAHAVPSGPGRLFTLDGRPLTTPHRSPFTVVPRPALLEGLRAGLPRRVRVVHAVVDDPADLDADLVVGADGVRSRVRGLVDPRAGERRATPYVALRGTTDAPPDPSEVGEYWGPGRLVGVVPSARGGYWFTTHRSDLGPEPLDVRATLAQARTLFADAAPVVRELLAADADDTTATRLWTAPPMRRYAAGRYVVIGDAAHAMTPNLARGAADAVLDAVTLAAEVRAGHSVLRWQARRFPSTQAARTASSAVMRLALLDRGHGLRDAALSVVAGVQQRAGSG